MFNTQNGYSLSDIAAATGRNGNNDGGMFNDGWWIIILLLCFGGWNGNGGFGGNGGGGATRDAISYAFDTNGLADGIRGVQQGLCDGFYAINTGLLNGFNSTQNTMAQGFAGINTAMTANTASILSGIHTSDVNALQNTYALSNQLNTMAATNAQCCCDTKNLIQSSFCDLNYNLANQACQTRQAIADTTRDVIENQNAGVRSILDFLTQDKIATLTAENQSLKLAASQAAQNNYLISELAPKLPVPAYQVPNPFANYGGCCNSFCGC
jgi:hypothetical protein